MHGICSDISARAASFLLATVAFVALVGALGGCAAQSQGQLPSTHTDQNSEVAASHARCGACHQGATRGNGVYDGTEYSITESLMVPGFVVELNHDDPNIAESLYAEPTGEGGGQ